MKKVIAFCLYGNLDRYCLGMLENIEIINNKYKDWVIYIYYNDIPEDILIILKSKSNTTLIECQSNGYKWEGMFWRFYPLDLTDIDIFLSRDADSRISDREMNLVNEWIESDKTFHIIRDHPYHYIEILGGTFGVKIKIFREKYVNYKNIDFYKNQYYGRYDKSVEKQPDQIFLKEIIYPFIKDDNLSHICDEILRFSENDILIPKVDNFVGDAILHPTYKIKEGLLHFHQGWTDIMNCLALINYYCRIYDMIYLLIRSEAKELVDFYTKDIPNLKKIYLTKTIIDSICPNEFKSTCEINIKNTENLFIGGFDNRRTDKYKCRFSSNQLFFVEGFYNYEMPYITRINDFIFQRDHELESRIYNDFIKEHGTNYILYHEVIENYDKNIKAINLKSISNLFFDMIMVLEKAIEIHLLDSVWGAFVYQLDAKYRLFKDKKIVLYAKRGYRQMFTEPIKLDNWIIE